MTEDEFIVELQRRYPRMVLVSAEFTSDLMHWARDAFRCLGRGADLMNLETLSQWEGVRAILESCPLSERYLKIDSVKDSKA